MLRLDRSRSRCFSILVVGLLALSASGCSANGAASAAEPAALNEPLPDDSPAKPFVGSYKFVGGEAERAAVTKAIDDTVAPMNGLIRGIARNRLIDANKVPEQLSFRAGGNTFAVAVDDRLYAGPLDGSPVQVTVVTGDVMSLRYKVGTELEQSFSDHEKERVNRFEIRGNQLIMHVRVHAGQLPKDLVYDLTFERI
jgi:hypothetical protein